MTAQDPGDAAETGLRIAAALETAGIAHAIGGAEAGRTRVYLADGTGRTVAFLSAEALALFKLLFFRPKDLADLERLVSVGGAHFERAYVRRWLVEMVGYRVIVQHGHPRPRRGDEFTITTDSRIGLAPRPV